MKQATRDDDSQAAVGPARLPLAMAVCLKLLLLCMLVIAVRSSGERGESASGVAPSSRLRANKNARRLLAQQPATEPAIAIYAQARLQPPQSPEEGGGSVLLPGLVPTGKALSPPPGDNLQPSVAACCAACRANPDCTAFWYCNRKGGCADEAGNRTAPHQGCQLVHQAETAPGTGRPVLLAPAPDFEGGAPLRHAAPAVDGYDAFPGLGFWYRFDFPCDGSVSQPDSCGLDGDPQQNAARCSADGDCQVLMWFPDGRDYPGAGRPVVLLKGGPGVGPLDLAGANINLNAVLYRKQAAAAAGSGGLSAGAIAGIAVGAACAALALALAAWVWVRRRRRRRPAERKRRPDADFPASCGASASSCGMDGDDKFAWAGQPPGTLGAPPGSASAAAASGFTPSSSWGMAAGGGVSHSGSARDVATPGSTSAAGGGFSRLVMGPGGEQHRAVGVYWAEASTASGLGSLPPGQGRSLPSGGQPLGVVGRVCPLSPPPSAANSLILPSHVPTTAAAAGTQAPVAAPPGQQLPSVAQRTPTAGQAAASPRAARSAAAVTAAGQPLLSQLPTYGWQRCLVDYAAIEFVLDAEGCPLVLGAGASATVYQVLLNGVEPHAAKVFRLGSDPRAQLDFLEEASLLRLLRHRSIVGFAGVCVAKGHGIILMELMEGGDLRSRNAEVDEYGLRRFGWYQRGRKVALDIATALHYLHSSSYTHFDCKSRNTLLSRDGTAKLADVGFTRALRATHHSVEGPIGTLDYMAPELLLNSGKCTNAVDIYSWGCLCHEICTGKYPSRGCLRDLHVPLEAPEEVAQLVAACLQEDPARRPTARQLVQTLMALQ